MLPIRIIVGLGLLLACLRSLASNESELEIRSLIQTKAAQLWLAKDYRALDELGMTYLRGKERTPSGLWKTAILISALKSRVNVEINAKDWNSYMEQVVKAWPNASPKSPFAHISVASALMQRAIKARGQGYANTVSEEGWRAFRQHTEEARVYLELTKTVSSQEGTWYSHMLEIATWQQWPEPKFRALLEEAMTRDPDFFPSYFAALNYYSPRWGGNAARVEWFAADIASKLGGERGDAMYARMYWWAADSYFEKQLHQSRIDCPRMLRGMQIIARSFPDPWNINHFAVFAVSCGNKEAARKYFAQIGDTPQLEAWNGSRPTFERFRAWAQQ